MTSLSPLSPTDACPDFLNFLKWQRRHLTPVLVTQTIYHHFQNAGNIAHIQCEFFPVGIPVLPEQVLPFNTNIAVLKFIPSLQYQQSLTFRYKPCSSSPCLVLVFLLISTKLQYTLSILKMKKFGQTDLDSSDLPHADLKARV